jgi:hypothetical protein
LSIFTQIVENDQKAEEDKEDREDKGTREGGGLGVCHTLLTVLFRKLHKVSVGKK